MAMLKHLLEYLGGVTDAPPAGMSIKVTSIFWGVWWACLLMVIYFTCGQSSKFIYIDF